MQSDRPGPRPTGHPDAPLRPVKEVVFGLLSPEEILRLSMTPEGIHLAQVDDARGVPVKGGLMDPRQGVSDKLSKCKTCHSMMPDCPGHFGHIDLTEPVYHVCFLPKVLKILRCVCYYCYKLLMPPDSPRFKAILSKTAFPDRRRFDQVYDLCKGKNVCDREVECRSKLTEKRTRRICGRRQPKYKREGLEIFIEWEYLDEGDGNRKQPLLPKHAREILAHISDVECRNMGIDPKVSRPEWMVATVFLVPPISVRPMAITFHRAKSHDDLTYKLADIVNANNILREAKEKGLPLTEQYDLLKVLQYHVATLVDNDMPGIPKSVHKASKKVVKSLKVRLKGKEGRIRGNLMGKRVDFSARTVITPDPCLKVDQVGIPQMIARNLTYPEIVTPHNIEKLEQLVAKGPGKYPGAKMVIKPNGDRVDLSRTYGQRRLKLAPGYKVERDLVDGDLVVFNRQPSLHKMSMMGHRVKVLPHSTFRMNLSCTTPYNADFDGDEMNLHVPQSVDVKAEVENLLLSTRNIITPQSNRPVMGIVQDSLTGAQKLTLRDTFIDRASLMNLLMQVTCWDGRIPVPAIVKPVPLWTGKQLFSVLIPGKLNVTGKHSTHPSEEDEGPDKWLSVGDTKVVVDQGELIMGTLCRKSLGTASGSLLHICMMERGHEITGIFYNDIQNVVNSWLRINAHSMGFKDCIIDSETSSNVAKLIANAKEKVAVINSSSNTEDPNHSKASEQQINSALNNVMNEAGRLVQNCLDDTNRLKNMVTAGSKGSLINISQINACMGQLNVEGKRIAKEYGNRSLPHFEPGDNSPESRGFVENSFFRGLEPHEYFFQCMAGREGLIDTAVKTAETGYIQRRLMKAMESVMVQYDGTVRNADGQIIEFSYGEDGLAGEKVEFQSLPTLMLNDFEFWDQFKCELIDYSQAKLFEIFDPVIANDLLLDLSLRALLEEEWNALENDRKELRKIFPHGNNRVVLPCSLKRMMMNIRKLHGITNKSKCSLWPRDVVEKVRDLTEGLKIFYGEVKTDEEVNRNATFLFASLVRATLCVKEVCERQRFSREAFEQLLGLIKRTFEEAKVEPGEMVGAIAAQSIGEPATQMTLNTFHFAGVSSQNVTLGIPRLKEIINISKNPKSPSLTVYLKENLAQDESKARTVAARLKCTILENVVLSTSVILDENLSKSILPEDQPLLDAFLAMPTIDLTKLSKWCLRIVIDRRKAHNEGIWMEEIAEKINGELKDRAFCFHSDDNTATLFLRIFLLSPHPKDEKRALTALESGLLCLRLKGIEAITAVSVRQTSGKDGSKQKMAEDGTGALAPVPEWIIETEGSALREVLAHPDVDATRTYSNDIWDTFNTLGIEAARKVIEMELRAVLGTYGLYVNYRHLSTLCSVMTSKGYLMPITRYGVNRQGLGPLMRCSFEETADVLIDAAVHSERDHIRGVSEHIIVGQIPRMGTGAFDVLLDTEKVCPKKAEELLESFKVDSSVTGLVGPDGKPIYAAPYLRKVIAEAKKKTTVAAMPEFGPAPALGATAGDTVDFEYSAEVQPVSCTTSGGPISVSPPYVPATVDYTPFSPPYNPTASVPMATSPSYSPVPASPTPNTPSYSPTPSYSTLSPPYAGTSGSFFSTTYSLPPYFTSSSTFRAISTAPARLCSFASTFSTANITSPTYSPIPVPTTSITSTPYSPAAAPTSTSLFTYGLPPEAQKQAKSLQLSDDSSDSDSDKTDQTYTPEFYDPFSFGDTAQATTERPKASKTKKKKPRVATTEKNEEKEKVVRGDAPTDDPSYSPFAPGFQPSGSQYNPDL